MKIIGTLTFHRAINYGAILQCYALQTAIKEMGFSTEIIDYNCQTIIDDYSLIKKKSVKSLIRSLLQFHANYKKHFKFKRFTEKYLTLSDEFTRDNLKEKAKKYSAVVVGSDQVWNSSLTGNDSTYFCDFLEDKRKRISYAASFGINEIGSDIYTFYKNGLSNMAWISLRESTSRELVKEICNKESVLDLDPVFLLEKSKWSSLCIANNRKKYLFVYMPGKKTFNIAKRIAEEKDLDIIYCAYEKSFFSPKKNIGKCYYSMGPVEFISYLANADYVVTGSFHATAFSIIFHKDFLSEIPQCYGSRIYDLLTEFNLKSRVISDDCLQKIDSIDWCSIDKKIIDKRRESLKHLKMSLEESVNA